MVAFSCSHHSRGDNPLSVFLDDLHLIYEGSTGSGSIRCFSRLIQLAAKFSDRSVYDGWWLLFKYVGECMALQMGLGLAIALLLSDIKREGLLVTIIMMVAPVVVGHLFDLLPTD
jgi:hypothetical protein